MNEIIKINKRKINNDLIQTVNARDLYNHLGLKKSQISRWIKSNITENPFVTENIDYIGFDINVEGNVVKEYAISIDLAKKICMLSRTEVGEKVRNYFLEIEKLLQNNLSDHKNIREKSKQVRRKFTDTLKEHGYNKRHHYIQTTVQMKKALDIDNKKNNMNDIELMKILASETIAEINIKQLEVNGYEEVNPVCVKSSKVVREATTINGYIN